MASPNIESPIEVIERKDLGHPDTVCDILSETVIRAYAETIEDTIGGVPNGSFDKVAVSGGEARIGFGYGEMIKPPTFYLFGKAMRIDGDNDYMEAIFQDVVERTICDIFKRNVRDGDLPPAKLNTVVDINAGIGAEHHPSFYAATEKPITDLWDYPLSNDTVGCVGWYPFTPHEQLTVELGNYVNGADFKAEFPETGSDVKVLTQRLGALTTVTLCVPFIAEMTPTAIYYEACKSEILQRIVTFVTDRIGPNASVNLNTKDVPGTGYLTLFGSAFDKGDSGMTGRGNRYPGLISLGRPSGVEAFPGKILSIIPGKSIPRLLSICLRLFTTVPVTQ